MPQGEWDTVYSTCAVQVYNCSTYMINIHGLQYTCSTHIQFIVHVRYTYMAYNTCAVHIRFTIHV